MRAVVVGSGLAGLTVANYLAEAGASVTVLERNEGPALGTSFGNSSMLHPSAAEPWNSPGIGRYLLRTLISKDPAVSLRLRALPSLTGWGWKFLRESSPASYRTNTLKNIRLALYSLKQMQRLRQSLGRSGDSSRCGMLELYRDEAALRHAHAARAFLEAHGVPFELLNANDVVALEPALAPIRGQLAGGLYSRIDEGENSFEFCTALESDLRRRGAVFRYGTDCSRFTVHRDHVEAAVDARGRSFEADVFILAAGSASTKLAQTAGISLPVRPVKGYSLTFCCAGMHGVPKIPLGDATLHIAVVPMRPDRLRIGGTAEFCGFNLFIEPARVARLTEHFAALYPAVRRQIEAEAITPWVGLRPMTPDGVPLLGRTSCDNLFLNTGHGHLGLTLAAASGKCVADMVVGNIPEIDPAPYALSRFNGRT
jgi:D-amino-acid dehydrogenase